MAKRRSPLTREQKLANEMARQCSEGAIRVLNEIMMHSDDEGARIKAANSILDRGLGKPHQSVAIENHEHSFRDLPAVQRRAMLLAAVSAVDAEIEVGAPKLLQASEE